LAGGFPAGGLLAGGLSTGRGTGTGAGLGKGGGVGLGVGWGIGAGGVTSGTGLTTTGTEGAVGLADALSGTVRPLAGLKAMGGSKEPKILGAQVAHAGSRVKS
jgi:hypothetical protein